MTRVLVSGDLHLGSGSDYGREPGERLREQAAVWQQIVDLAVEQDVDALLFGGDAFEGPQVTPEQYLAFADPLADLPFPVIAITGNGRHDAALRERNALEVVARGSLRVHTRPGLHQIGDLFVACLPWAPVSRLVAAQNGGDRAAIHDQAAGLVIEIARGLRAEIPSEAHAILLLHWSVSGSSLPSGLPVDQLREPVLPLAELEAMGWDAVVAGHIHAPQQFSREVAPMFYVGSPMPLNFGEATCEHGAWLLEPDTATLHARERGLLRATFLPIESRSFVVHDIDAVEAVEITDPEADLGFWPDQFKDAIVKVRYKATAEQARRIDHGRLRDAAHGAGAHKVFIEASVERAARARAEGVDEGLDEMAALDRYLVANAILGDAADRIRERMSRYLEEAAGAR